MGVGGDVVKKRQREKKTEKEGLYNKVKYFTTDCGS